MGAVVLGLRRRLKAALVCACLSTLTTACLTPPIIVTPASQPLALRSRVLAADGTELATLFVENRESIPLDRVPRHLVDAVVAAEDQRYWSHTGVDVKAITRAAVANAAAGRVVQGGSTITQQYVKNHYFSVHRPRTLEQKVLEAQLAWKLEQRIGKKKLLERYLNTVYFGEGAYGIQAAAEQYFRKTAETLALEEAALLAGLIRSPESDDPRRDPERAKVRRDYILGRMADLGMIQRDHADAAKQTPVTLADPPLRAIREQHFVEYVKQSIMRNPAFGADEGDRAALMFKGGIEVRTTLDLRMQEIARQVIGEVLDRPGDPEAALVAIDPVTGRVVAMIGGRDFSKSQVNLALGRDGGGSGRQPGSSFKAFVLATALEDGLRAGSTISAAGVSYRVPGGELWRPRNAEGSAGGSISLLRATSHSVNTAYARLGLELGPSRVVRMAQRMGVTAKLGAHPSISLGSEEVSVLDMAAGYATLANYGTHISPSPIDAITTPEGEAIRPQRSVRRALDPGIAWLATDILRHVITEGTGQRADIGRPAAGKTGTSQTYADAWFVGYTPQLVTAVWVGYPQGRIPMYNVHGVRVFGGTFPAMIWSRFMTRALAGAPVIDFALPEQDLITIDIDPATGLLAGPWCSGSQQVQMLRQLAPTKTCPEPPPAPSPEAPPPTTTVTPATGTATPAESPSPAPSPSPT